MNSLQQRNPHLVNQAKQMMNNNIDVSVVVKQMAGGIPPEQMGQLLQVAKQIGVPDNILSEIQNCK